MSYDSKSNTEKEFGYRYDEVTKDPTTELGDEYQEAKYVLSTLNKEHATTIRSERRESNTKTIIAAIAVGVASVGAIAYTMISGSKKDESGQMTISLPVSMNKISVYHLFNGELDCASLIYKSGDKFIIDTKPLFSGDYIFSVIDTSNTKYKDTSTIESDRGILKASSEWDGKNYAVTLESGDLSDYTHFASYLYEECNLSNYVSAGEGKLIAEGEVISASSGEIIPGEAGNYCIVTFGTCTRYDGAEVSVPLVGTNLAVA